MLMWSSSLCGISFKTMPSFPVVEFLFAPHSTNWSGLVRSALLSPGERKKKLLLGLLSLQMCNQTCFILHEHTIQMLTYISDVTETHSLVRAFFFLRTRLLGSILNILFILLTSATFCLYQRDFYEMGLCCTNFSAEWVLVPEAI